ncbi:F-box/FBD/LRR-repeat protein At5g44980-like isoform X4 [Punica granatum]|uniref:F-box/FBD/LRR-repeat protein At5g44980-like isoform X4 n=1 Tax=Punica granatum TaxID=22663 RepID=A0A6P8C7U2_PUNGR|nr:F-box/FBD/LRR-repeat protein At5g44980-like isoform X4 [Punica granatum]
MAIESKLSRCSDTADRLSMLPDEILIRNILVLLPTEEAARTSILSRRWRSLWLYILGLDFKAPGKPVACGCRDQKQILLHEAASKYADRVNQLIGAYRGKGTELLEFAGRWDRFTKCYKFPSIEPLLSPNLRLLKCLTLKYVSISTDSLDPILLRCEFLERLHLHHLLSRTQVNVTGPMSRLKYIDISQDCYSLASIIISAPTPDLVSLRYPSWVKISPIEHAPQLVDLVIDGCRNLERKNFELLSHPLFCYVSQLQAIDLDIPCFKKLLQWLPHFPDLSGLRHLKSTLGDDCRDMQALHGVISLIKAAPYLQHLTLDVENLREEVMIGEESADLHHKYRRVIEIIQFTGREVEFAFAAYLIKGLLSLEKLIITRRSRSSYYYKYRPAKITFEEWKRRALELKKILPLKVEVVVT